MAALFAPARLLAGISVLGFLIGLATSGVLAQTPSTGAARATAAPTTRPASSGGVIKKTAPATDTKKPPPSTKPANANAQSGSGTANTQNTAAAGFEPRWLGATAVVVLIVVALLRWVFGKYARADRQRDVVIALVTLYGIGLVATAFLPLRGADWVVLDFVAVMTSLGAAFFGFLFGLPQTVPNAAPTAPEGAAWTVRSRPSTNLETVADQLTKFITGAAFASLAVATGYIDRFGSFVAGSLTPPAPPSGALVGDMLLVGYATLGFTIAYIITRTQLSLSFHEADAVLLNEASIVISATLPDIGPGDASDEQRLLARRVVNLPFESLRYDEERLTWARAQSIVEDWPKARAAYAKLFASDPKNVDTIIEYATAVYNDNPRGDQDLVLTLLRSAHSVPVTDPTRLSRIAALTAATNLYVSGGYAETIRTVNDFLKTGRSPSRNLRYYRACAFGQLYRALKAAGKLLPEDDVQITKRITMDSLITAAFGEGYRQQLIDVVIPSKSSPEDDDLQAFAADHPDFVRDILGMPDAPQYPQARTNGRASIGQSAARGKDCGEAG